MTYWVPVFFRSIFLISHKKCINVFYKWICNKHIVRHHLRFISLPVKKKQLKFSANFINRDIFDCSTVSTDISNDFWQLNQKLLAEWKHSMETFVFTNYLSLSKCSKITALHNDYINLTTVLKWFYIISRKCKGFLIVLLMINYN